MPLIIMGIIVRFAIKYHLRIRRVVHIEFAGPQDLLNIISQKMPTQNVPLTKCLTKNYARRLEKETSAKIKDAKQETIHNCSLTFYLD